MLFDDAAWVVRYLVVETEPKDPQRHVLVSAKALDRRDWWGNTLQLSLSMAELVASPAVDTDKSVCRQHQLESLDHYSGLGYAESTAECRLAQAETRRSAESARPGCDGPDDPHLRSAAEVISYRLCCIDGAVGRVKGLLIDDASWAIRFMVVTTGRWWRGHPTLIAPESIDDVRWADAVVHVKLSRQAVTCSHASVSAV